MRTLPALLLGLALPLCAADEAAEKDPVEAAFREAWADYKKGDHEATAEKLRELLRMIEDKTAAKVEALLPDQVDHWKAEELKRDDLSVVGGGISISRLYLSGKRRVEVKVVKDSPILKSLLPLITNEQMIELSGRETHTISGETAIMEGERKMQMVLDERVYLELVAGGEADEKDLLRLARGLDLRALGKIR